MGSVPRATVRLFGWALAIGSIGLGCAAVLVGALDTQRTCVLMFDEACDGPHWGDALVAFGIAAVLLAAGVALIVRLRRPPGASVDAGDG
jgi:hypothetical protein